MILLLIITLFLMIIGAISLKIGIDMDTDTFIGIGLVCIIVGIVCSISLYTISKETIVVESNQKMVLYKTEIENNDTTYTYKAISK